MSSPTVSIILPTYNSLDYLREAVASVLAQTHESWELIVIDDGSTDGTGKWLASLGDDRIRVLAERHTGNLSYVRNAGISASTSRWIAFLDADDVFLPAKLERQLAYHAAHPGVRWSYTGRMLIDACGARLDDERFPWNPVGGWILLRLLLHEAVVASTTMMMERALLAEIGGLDERFRFAGDYDLRLRLAVRAECGVIDEPLTQVRQHRASRTSKQPEAVAALAQVYREFGTRPASAEVLAACRRQEAQYRLKLSRLRFERREWPLAWRSLGASVRLQPLNPLAYRLAAGGLVRMLRGVLSSSS